MTILGIDILALSTAAWLSVTPAAAPVQCLSAPKTPEIKIEISEGPIRFNTNKSRSQLTQMKDESPIYSPYSPNDMHNSLVGGMMSGVLRLDHKMNFVQHYNPGSGDGCVHLDEVTVQIHLSPKVYIASEFRDNACWFGEILSHELKHLDVDRSVSHQYSTHIDQALKMALNTPSNYWSGSIERADMGTAKDKIKAQVESILNAAFKSMSKERSYLQRSVDTPEEYQAITNACDPIDERS